MTPFDVYDRAVFLPATRTLVVADLHLGRSRTAPVETPLDGQVRIGDRIVALVRHLHAREVVLAGDVLDAFDRIPPGVSDRFSSLQDRIEASDATLVVCRGNHDVLLEGMYDGPLRSAHLVADTLVLHGDEEPRIDAARYVIGHEHPAIRIEGVKRPCYLYGEGVLDGADVLVLPAFSRLIRGTTMAGRSPAELHSPLLRELELDQFRPILAEAPDLTFPTLGTLRPFLQ